MHRALRVPEILLIILKFIKDDLSSPPRATLAAMARSCQAFKRPAEEVLWSDLHSIKPFYPILPVELRKKQSQMWSLTHRTITGANWSGFMECAGLVRVITVSEDLQWGACQGPLRLFVNMARLSRPILLTPNLRELKWTTRFRSIFPAIRLFIGPSLLSLELDAESLLEHVNCLLVLGDTCPNLKHIKITGNCRSIASTISRVICGLHHLETASCSTLNDDALVHLAGLESLRHLALDLRWSDLHLGKIQNCLPPGSFRNVGVFQCKDYNLSTLRDIFLLPDFSPSSLLLEIETFCTTSFLHPFLLSVTSKFPDVQCFSLVHDVHARRRFGYLPAVAGREHIMDASAMEPLLGFKNLRKLELERLGFLVPGDDFVLQMGSTWPNLETLRITNGAFTFWGENPPIGFECFLSLLRHCPNLQDLGLCINTKDILLYADTDVRSTRLTQPRLIPSKEVSSRPEEVAQVLLRILPEITGVDKDYRSKEWSEVMRCVDRLRAKHATGQAIMHVVHHEDSRKAT